jgi:hypothetical protein
MANLPHRPRRVIGKLRRSNRGGRLGGECGQDAVRVTPAISLQNI